jgi:hypothetical protein
MSPADYRAALARLGWSIYGAGPKLGVKGRQSQRWASGFTPIPKRTEMLLAVAEKRSNILAEIARVDAELL